LLKNDEVATTLCIYRIEKADVEIEISEVLFSGQYLSKP